MSKREVEIGRTITLGSRFYLNGNLVDPYNISSVQVFSAPSNGVLLATLPAPVRVSQGIWQTSWNVPTSASLGLAYDSWTWQATAAMPSNTKIYRFRILASPDIAPPKPIHGPLFVGHQEVNFFNSITKELIQKVIAQKVIYYAISEKFTKTNNLYDEAIKKTVYTPVEVNALVLYKEPNETATKFTIDTIYSIEVYFHIHELLERNLTPREGDFLKWGEVIYEIEKLNKPQIVYGQIENKVMIKANCRVSRKSQFEVLDNIKSYNET